MNLRTKIAINYANRRKNNKFSKKKSIQELNDSQEKTQKISISSEACGYKNRCGSLIESSACSKNSSISSEARSSSSKASGSGSLSEASSITQFTQTKYSLSSICKQLKQKRLEFTIISIFEDSTDYENFISDNYIHTKTTISSLVKCSCLE
ncbi:unnamed protein product, partial [Brachionus calyciflorus]